MDPHAPSAPPRPPHAKRVVVVLAGGFDPPGEATPLADAETPALDRMARIGRPGVADLGANSPWDGFAALLGLAGAAPSLGACEALGLGVAVGEGEAVYRADFVTLADGRVRDPFGGRVKDPEASILLDAVRAASPSARLVRAGGHRNVVVLPAPAQFCPSSWEMVGRSPVGGLPSEGPVRGLFDAASAVLAREDVNSVRIDLGENPANALWIHGGGAAASARESDGPGVLVGRGAATLGLARALGWQCALSEGDDDALAAAALAALATSDLVVVRTESVLDAGVGGAAEKRDALSRADARLVAPLLAAAEERDAFVMAVAADSLVDASSHALVRRAVPFVVAGIGECAGLASFDEISASAAGFHLASGAAFAALWS